MPETEMVQALVAQLGELYETERQLLKQLPRVIRWADAKQLKATDPGKWLDPPTPSIRLTAATTAWS